MSEYGVKMLGESARRFLRERLDWGRTLSHEVSRLWGPDVGSVYTYVPVDTSDKGVNDFEDGFKGLSLGVTTSWLIGLIQQYLLGAQDRICVFEHAGARAHHPGIRRMKSTIVTFEDHVYYILQGAECGETQIATAIKESGRYPCVGLMTRTPPGWDPRSGKFTRENLTYLADNAEKVLLDAYDAEGWLIWDRT